MKNLTSASSSITLYAKWGSYGNIYLPNASRTGHSFAGWYTSASGGSKVGDSGSGYAPANSEPTSLYAHWTANSYAVTFNPVGGSVSPTSKSVTYGQKYGTLPQATHSEYVFDGWFTGESIGTEIKSSTTVSTPRDHTLYAHWKNGRMTLTFNPDIGDLPDGVPNTRTYLIGQPFGELPIPECSGYQFSGWWTDDTFET